MATDSARNRAKEAQGNTIDLSSSPPMTPANLAPGVGSSNVESSTGGSTTFHSRFTALTGITALNMATGTVPSNSEYPSTPPRTSGYDSPPRTPKGHPMPMNANDYLSRSSLMGFLGGGGTGVRQGMKGSLNERDRALMGVGGARRNSAAGGKFYPPEQSSKSASFTSTISYLTRGIPRKIRAPLFALVCLVLLATVGFKIAHERAETLERMQMKRFAAGLQKAYIVDASPPGAQGEVKPVGNHPQLQPDTYRPSVAKAVGVAAREKQTERPAAAVIPFDAGNVDFKMNKRQETAALLAFITSTSNNALPANLDFEQPLDPQLVLDFDYTRPTAAEHLAALVHDTYTMYPVVLFGQMRDPYYREMRKLFSAYVVHPAPLVVEVDQRADESVLVGLLKRLVGIQELPVLLLNGVSAGTWSQIQEFADNGNFMRLIATKSTANIQEKKLKKRPKGVKDAERAEKERILSPKPIVDEA